MQMDQGHAPQCASRGKLDTICGLPPIKIAALMVWLLALPAAALAQVPNTGDVFNTNPGIGMDQFSTNRNGMGDQFNTNPGGGFMPGEPAIDRFGRDAQCGGTNRVYYDSMYGTTGVVMSIPEMQERYRRGEVIRCGVCMTGGQQLAICWLRPAIARPPPQFCSADIPQAILDFDRGLFDTVTFGATKYWREKLWADDGQILNQDAANAGAAASLAAAFIPVPGVQQSGEAKLAITFEEFARSPQVSAAAARIVSADASLVWQLGIKMRGEIIERVVAVLEYAPRGYDWVGVLRGGTFRNIDFINYALKEQVSLKSMFRPTPESWRSGVSQMKTIITDLAGMEKTWQTWTGQELALECRAAADQWKRVLDLRVPPGYQGYVQELVPFGKQYGIEVRIRTF
jgi:hypothetical protein